MDPVELNEIPAGLTAGRLEGISFPNLLWALCRSGKTGVLRVTAEFPLWLYIDRCRVVFAASENPDRRIGALLLRQGVIQLSDLRAALELQQEAGGRENGDRLGMLLVGAGCIDDDELVDALRAQFRDIVADLFALDAGEYAFAEGQLPTDESITLVETTERLIHDGIHGVRSFDRIRREVGGPGTLYALTDDWRERISGLALGGGANQVVERLERGEESVEYLCREVLLSNFEIHQTLWSLAVLGAIRRVPPGSEPGDDDAFRRPESGEGFVEFLLRLCRSGATGVLYASRGAIERSFHLSDGRCIFATSSDSDDGLVTHLLRRGVISLRDREEAVRRLLSNKRVGTILLELGVLDEQDLRDAVRQQLGEIVWNTVRWDEGDYVFVVGPLPSIEEITLDLDIEALLAEGMRRVTSWSRVRRGSGGLESRLALTPSYLDVLDAMQAGVEEWDISATLREPRTPLEVCELLGLGDFRVCQVLWCLRVLGAVEVVEHVEETVEEAVVVRSLEPRPVEVPLLDLDRATDIPIETILAVERHARIALPILFRPQWCRPHVPVDVVEVVEADPSVDVVDETLHELEALPVPVPAVEEPVFSDRGIATGEEAFSANARDPARAVTPEVAAPEESAIPEQAAEPEDASSIWQMERSTRTLRMSREEIAVALEQPPQDDGVEVPLIECEEPAVEREAEPDSSPIPVEEHDSWDPPAGLEDAIARFNATQRLVYRTVRVEVGAGAANFIRACCSGDAGPDPIGDTELNSDGSWDSEGLREAAIASRLDEPWQVYQRLIDVEVERLKEMIGAPQAEALLLKIEQIPG